MKARYHVLTPAVYGELGEGTILDTSVHPPVVERLHLVMDRPPEDDLHTSFPCFFASDRLGRAILDASMTGAELASVRVELNDQAVGPPAGDGLAPFHWLKVAGSAGTDDFGINEQNNLVVSAAALAILRRFRLDECTVYDAGIEPSAEQVMEDAWAEARKVAEKIRADLRRGK